MRQGDYMIRAVWPGTRRKQLKENLIAVALSIGVFFFLLYVLIISRIAEGS